MLLNPVRNRFGIFQTVRMMRVTVLDHDCDAAAQLLVAILDWQRVSLEQKIRAPTNIQQRNIVPRQFSQPREGFRTNRRVVRVNARDFVRIRGGPVVFVDAAFAHADEGRFF